MSSHFSGHEEMQRKFLWRNLLRRDFVPTTPAEIRFVRHAKMRAALLFMYCLGFVYLNPEYSYTMTYINDWLRERRDRRAEEERKRTIGTPRPPSVP